MRSVIVRDAMRIPLGKQGENNAVRVVWPGIVEKYAKLYGKGRFELVVVQKGKAYPAVVSVTGADLVWDVHAADVATAEVGSLELIYYVGDTIAKSQTWETIVVASKSADGMTEPPEDPARAWFDEIKRQIGDLNKLTTNAKENLVAAINEAARTGSGGGGTVEMRVDGGYIQYSTDGVTWKNLIAVASLEGKPGKDGEPGEPGAPGKDGEPGKDGHTPKIAATKTGKTTSVTADGVEIAQIKDGEDAAADPTLGITGAQVGQIAKITAVDTDGKPTAWEPVEMAWDETEVLTLSEDVNAVAFDLKGCNSFAIVLDAPPSDTDRNYVLPTFNSVVGSFITLNFTNKTHRTISVLQINKIVDGLWFFSFKPGNAVILQGAVLTKVGDISVLNNTIPMNITSMGLNAYTGQFLPKGIKIYVLRGKTVV